MLGLCIVSGNTSFSGNKHSNRCWTEDPSGEHLDSESKEENEEKGEGNGSDV